MGVYVVVDGDFFLGGGFGSEDTDGVFRAFLFLELPRPPSTTDTRDLLLYFFINQ